MAEEYLASDVHGLLMLATLREMYERKPGPTLAGEIRMQEMRYGLSPVDRRRLNWAIKRVEGARRPPPPDADNPKDPREFLRLMNHPA